MTISYKFRILARLVPDTSEQTEKTKKQEAHLTDLDVGVVRFRVGYCCTRLRVRAARFCLHIIICTTEKNMVTLEKKSLSLIQTHF